MTDHATAIQNHYNRHSRTNPITNCNQPECVRASKCCCRKHAGANQCPDCPIHKEA